MYARTQPMLRLFSRKKDMQSMVEGHFWSLTRYRILPRFLGLDLAGNVIFFPSYRRNTFGGWTAVTLGAPGSSSNPFISSDTNAMNVLEDGHPLHYKASRKLQLFVAAERQRWQAKTALAQKAQAEATAAGAKGDAQKTQETAAGENAGAASGASKMQFGAEVASQQVGGYDSEQQFRDLLAIKCSQPRFYSGKLRVNRLVTLLYKCFYFYLWAVLVSLIVQGYLMFRAWVNTPARQGLKNIEEHVLHIPRLLFSGCVSGVVWLVHEGQPAIDAVVAFLSTVLPQINWNAASAENLAAKAQHLADGTHPKAEERRALEKRQLLKTEEARKTWWTRALMVLLAIFSILCVL